MTTSPDLLEFAPGVFRLRIPGGGAHLLNSYLIVDDDGVTLFDTGWADSAPHIEAALASLGRGIGDVTGIVLSHFHDDHAGAAAALAAASGARVMAGAAEAPVVRGEAAGPLPAHTPAELAIHAQPTEPPAAAACGVDVELADGQVLDIGGGARVLHTPGHTPGSIALYLTRSDVVLTGDTIAEFFGDVILGVFNTDRAAARRSVDAIAATGAANAGFGHGEVVTGDASRRIADAADPFADTAG